jgi:hypothetical protein
MNILESFIITNRPNGINTWQRNTLPYAPIPSLHSSWKNVLKYPSAMASAENVLVLPPLLVPSPVGGRGVDGLEDVSFEIANSWK